MPWISDKVYMLFTAGIRALACPPCCACLLGWPPDLSSLLVAATHCPVCSFYFHFIFTCPCLMHALQSGEGAPPHYMLRALLDRGLADAAFMAEVRADLLGAFCDRTGLRQLLHGMPAHILAASKVSEASALNQAAGMLQLAWEGAAGMPAGCRAGASFGADVEIWNKIEKVGIALVQKDAALAAPF
eukprot:scaffold96387_cov18-Tisochrysis_lutea.AAC.1